MFELPTVAQVLFTLVAALAVKWILTFAHRRFFMTQRTELHNPKWKEDVVYLFQFKRSPVVPNLSPFCLKLEAWLRAHNIKHEVCASWMQRSKEGLLPFVELNGEHIADSQLILFRLQKHFNIDDGLSVSEKGVARAVDRMIEGNTFYALLYSKVYENAKKFLSPEVSGAPVPSFFTNFLANKFTSKIGERLHANGISRHKREDIVAILRKDIEAIDEILGDKKFLFGDKPTVPDFTMFGHLASTYYLPYRQPITDLLDDEFPRVKAHVVRMRTHYFPEWKFE